MTTAYVEWIYASIIEANIHMGFISENLINHMNSFVDLSKINQLVLTLQ